MANNNYRIAIDPSLSSGTAVITTSAPIGGGSVAVINPQSQTTYTLLGERVVIDPQVPFGDITWNGGMWFASAETYTEIRSRSAGTQQSIVSRMRQSRKEGKNVVAGVVQHDPRRRASGPRQAGAKGDLESLAERSKGLVRQIGELLDVGPIPDGTMAELTKTVAAMQAERDAIAEALSEIDGNLSLGRGLVIEFSMGDV